MNLSHAKNKYVRISAKKVNRVLSLIRGKSYTEAMLMLEFLPYRACKIIKKTLESAACNASQNIEKNKNLLTIQHAFANKGPTLKRFQPRAQGRGFPIQKPTCHITITVKHHQI